MTFDPADSAETMTFPVDAWQEAWSNDLRAAADADQLRELRTYSPSGPWVVTPQGQRLVHACSNDYLGLAQDPRLVEASAQAGRDFGVGAQASRLITGTTPLHDDTERLLADWKHAEAALVLPSGMMANFAAVTALVGPDDLVLQDKLNHASLIDAARLSGATLRTFPHRDLDALQDRLQRWAPRHRRVLIATDTVFSMDGDTADLPGLLDCAERHGALLLIDEAHATGLLGSTGSGLAEHQGVAGRIPVTVSTASKALGGMGGIISGSSRLIQTVVNRARPAIYTTGIAPPQVAVIREAVRLIQDEPSRRDTLQAFIHRARTSLRSQGWGMHDSPTPILPLRTGSNPAALKLTERLRLAGVLSLAIRPPTVAPGTARVRLSLRADMTPAMLAQVLDAVPKANSKDLDDAS